MSSNGKSFLLSSLSLVHRRRFCASYWGYSMYKFSPKTSDFLIIWKTYNLSIYFSFEQDDTIIAYLFPIFPEFNEFQSTYAFTKFDINMIKSHSLIVAKSRTINNGQITISIKIIEPSFVAIVKHKHTSFLSRMFALFLLWLGKLQSSLYYSENFDVLLCSKLDYDHRILPEIKTIILSMINELEDYIKKIFFALTHFQNNKVGLLIHIAKYNFELFEYLMRKCNINYKIKTINNEIINEYAIKVKTILRRSFVDAYNEFYLDYSDVVNNILDLLMWDYEEMGVESTQSKCDDSTKGTIGILMVLL